MSRRKGPPTFLRWMVWLGLILLSGICLIAAVGYFYQPSPYARAPELPISPGNDLPGLSSAGWETGRLAAQNPADLASAKLTVLPAEAFADTPQPAAVSDLALRATSTLTPLPAETSSLLYLANSSLMLWDHVTGYAITLADEVDSYVASRDGKTILLLRPQNIAANGIDLYTLDRLDLTSKQITRLLDKTPRLYALSLSPDGRWLAYLPQKDNGPVLLSKNERASQAIEMGDYQGFLGKPVDGLAWSPDGLYVLWSDQRGIWLAQAGHPPAQLIHPSSVQITDPAGKDVEIGVHFTSFQWSPAGRYALLHVTPVASEVSWWAILDTRMGRLAEVADSFEYKDSSASLDWSANGDLMSTHTSGAAEPAPILIKNWRVMATNPHLLFLQKTFSLSPLPGSSTTNQAYYPGWLGIISGEKIYLSISPIEPVNQAGPALYSLQLEDGKARKELDIPIEPVQVLYAPDESGALILGAGGEVLFASLAGQATSDLRPILGSNAHDFTWLPPAPRY